MIEEKFSNLEELYQRLLPALRTKKNEMRQGHMEITEKRIWLYFCENIWNQKSSLTLGEMVNDILNTDGFIIFSYGKGENYGDNRS